MHLKQVTLGQGTGRASGDEDLDLVAEREMVADDVAARRGLRRLARGSRRIDLNVQLVGAVTAEALGTEIRAAALALMAEDLALYPLEAIEKALWRCRREVTGRLTLVAVIERIQEEDGRPPTEEAWAAAVLAEDEAQTVVWTAEMKAFAAARSLLDLGDPIAARMAFRDAYHRRA